MVAARSAALTAARATAAAAARPTAAAQTAAGVASSRRTFFSFGRKKPAQPAAADRAGAAPKAPLLGPDDLFHRLSESPIAEMRAKGERMRQLALCPVSMDKYGAREPVSFECPNCGFPTHASEEHWAEDQEQHARFCQSRLREANEDEHDLRSGREFPEFAHLPDVQPYEEAISMANWDVFLYTRGFPSVETERSRRHISKLLTYPLSIGAVLHDNSPYTLRNQRLLPEGLRSLLALRQELHPPQGSTPARLARPPAPVRIVVLGARAESSLPGAVLHQLCHLFPGVAFHIFFVGPESYIPPHVAAKHESTSATEGQDDRRWGGVPSYTRIESDVLTTTSLRCSYDQVHDTLAPFDPYQDVFFAFSPGFGFPSERDPARVQLEDNWLESVLQILETKCALFCTGFSPADIERDVLALERVPAIANEFDWLLAPGENVFASEKWEVAEFDPRVAVKTNWGVWGIRGKRYDVRQDAAEEDEE